MKKPKGYPKAVYLSMSFVSLLPNLQPGHLPLVRTVNCLAGAGQCGTDGEAGCVWDCAFGAYC